MTSPFIDLGRQEPTVDLDAATRRLGGSRSLLVDLARFCVEDAPELLGRLQEAIRSDDRPTAARVARRLKCLAANFDASPTVEIASELESTARDGDLADTAVLEPILHRQFEELTSLLRETVLDCDDG